MTSVIRLRFVRERSVSSVFIRWFGGGLPFTHVGAISDDGTYELGARVRPDGAAHAGLQRRPVNYAAFTASEVVEIPCSIEEHRIFWSTLFRYEGMRYSRRTIIGFIIGRDLNDRRGFDCSAAMEFAMMRTRTLLSPELIRFIRRSTPDSLWAYALGLRHGRNHGIQP